MYGFASAVQIYSQWRLYGFFSYDQANHKICFEWYFRCDYEKKVSGFDGCSFMTVEDSKFTVINEYKTESKRYYPYN